MRVHRASTILVVMLAIAVAAAGARAQIVRVGSKNFTEQVLLGELVAQVLEAHAGCEVERRFGLGGTGICHQALVAGELDLYVEYSGTALNDVLRERATGAADAVHRQVARAYRERFDLEWMAPLGFDNTYVFLVRRKAAQERGWRTISDLAGGSGLRCGFTSEFIERPDGLAAIRRGYGFEPGSVQDLDPGIMYEALAADRVDVIGGFSTDGRIDALDLAPLADDRGVFPPYRASPVARAGFLSAFPEARDALGAIAGALDDATMRRLNSEVDIAKRTAAEVAAEWLAARGNSGAKIPARARAAPRSAWARLGASLAERRGEIVSKCLEHLAYVLVATAIAAAIGLPAGILLAKRPRAAEAALAIAGVFQTVPSLALLAFLFALIERLGAVPAVTALVLYGLMPILLNTILGIRGVRRSILEAADALGLTKRQRLLSVELPLARRSILAGIRAAVVLAVGTATLSTYIGAGGLGDFIARGLARNDPGLTLLGAIPAALLAVLLSWLVRIAEKSMEPPDGAGR